jgi:hypothetical protein
VPIQDRDDLDVYEEWARERLERLLGPLRLTDYRGGPPGRHDFEADLSDGSIAAVEVTAEVDRQRLTLASAADRHLASLTLDGSSSLWLVGLAANARVNAIRSEAILQLLADLEADGRRNATDLGNAYQDPFIGRLSALGIESIYAVKAKAGHEGEVMVRPGAYGGWGWNGPTIDTWLEEILRSDRGDNKLNKLRRANARERHLVIVLDSFSQAGVGIRLGLHARRGRGAADYALPSVIPPVPLTQLWLLPSPGTSWDGLCWEAASGWAVLEPWSPSTPT